MYFRDFFLTPLPVLLPLDVITTLPDVVMKIQEMNFRAVTTYIWNYNNTEQNIIFGLWYHTISGEGCE